MKLISKHDAKKLGLKYYYTGKPCKHGHVAERAVNGGMCKACKQYYGMLYAQNNKQKIQDYHKNRHKETYSSAKRRKSYELHLEKELLYRSSKRAKKHKIEFNLLEEDIIIPSVCPVLGIPLQLNEHNRDFSPSLDRKDNTKGYTKDNITIISNRANRIKSDASVEEIEKILQYMKGI